MNRKQFLLLLAVVVVLGAAGLIIYQRGNSSWNAGGAAIGQKLLPALSVNDVAQITVKSGTNELNLERREDVWRVRERGDYPANFQQISELLLKLADLKAVQNEDIGPSQLARLELLPSGGGEGAGTSLELKDQNGKTLGTLLLGKKHMKKAGATTQFGGMDDESWPDGRYVMTASKTVAVISDPLDNVQPKPDDWLNKDFLNVEKPRSIALQFPVATNSWTLTRASETNDWQLANAKPGEKLDSSKISSVTSPFSSASFSDVGKLSPGNASSNTVLTVETFDGFKYTARIGPKLEDNYPVSFSISADLPANRTPANGEKPEDKARLDKDFQARQKTLAEKLAKEQAYTNWTYQLPGYSMDDVLKTRQQLMEEETTNSVTARTEK